MIRNFFGIISAIYILWRFIVAKAWRDKAITIVFSRGAFKHDIKRLASDGCIIIVHAEILRRLFRIQVPDGFLEQVISLFYRDYLISSFAIPRKFLSFLLKNKSTIVLFGGVDYFEVAIFADRNLYPEKTRIDAIFHENYAIEYVKNLNFSLYSNLPNKFMFDQLYTYGQPATSILKSYTLNSHGPVPMTMPRLSVMADDFNFFDRVNKIENKKFSKSILLLAFPGSEYLAPICYTATMLELSRLSKIYNYCSIIKFKNRNSAKSSLKQAGKEGRYIKWVFSGLVEDLVWECGFAIVFNSISFYEALLGPSIVLIPAYMDSQHDENLLQETRQTVGKLKSVVFISKLSDIHDIVSIMKTSEIRSLVEKERGLRRRLVESKFYLPK